MNAIRRLLADQVDAWSAGDARVWSAPLVDDAVFINIVGMRFAGRQPRHPGVIRMAFLRVDARWNDVRDHPRFQALSRRLGLEGGQAYGRY